MGATVDLAKNEFVAELVDRGIEKGRVLGREEGREEGKVEFLLKVLPARFGPLPPWAVQRIARATPAQLDRWVAKLISAPTLEGVLGRR